MRRHAGLMFLLTALAAAVTAPAAVNRWSGNGPFGGLISALAIAPSNSDSVYAGGEGGAFFRSTDAGEHWRRAGRGLPRERIIRIVVSPANANRRRHLAAAPSLRHRPR